MTTIPLLGCEGLEPDECSSVVPMRGTSKLAAEYCQEFAPRQCEKSGQQEHCLFTVRALGLQRSLCYLLTTICSNLISPESRTRLCVRAASHQRRSWFDSSADHNGQETHAESRPDLHHVCQHALQPATLVVSEIDTGINERVLKELWACMQALRGLVRITPISIRALPRHDTRPVARFVAASASMGKSGERTARCRMLIHCMSPGQRYLTFILCRYLQDSCQESSRGPRW